LHDAIHFENTYREDYRAYRPKISKLKRDLGQHVQGAYGNKSVTRCAGCDGTSPSLSILPDVIPVVMYCKNCLVANQRLQGLDGAMAGYLVARGRVVAAFEAKVLEEIAALELSE
jgi:hypothetical protein